ncbi:MAG: LD-carboxypeptidase, partial [Candidatus Paceibacterota bacterium]
MDIIKPKKLNKGDTVGIVSPSAFIADELKPQFQKGVEFLDSLGLRVKIGKNVFKRYFCSAGTVDERVSDIHEMFSDPEVKAIIQSQGGETANELLDHLDWELIRNNPK